MNLKSFLVKYFPAFLILFILLAFSIAAYQSARTSSFSRRSTLFKSRVQGVTALLNNRMTDYIQILRGYQGLFYASDTVTSNDWKIYSDNLQISDNYPGIQAVAYAPYLLKSQTESLEKRIQIDNKAFRIKSTFKNNYITPVIKIEPFTTRNLRAWGFDLYSDSTRREAIDRAISTGQASITKKVKLIQETEKNIQPGFLMFLPVYNPGADISTAEKRKKNVTGLVANVFRTHDLMGVLFEQFADLHIEIYDGTDLEHDKLFYDSDSILHSHSLSDGKKLDFKDNITITIAGNPWTIFLSPNAQFNSSLERQQPLIILLFGLSISFLLFIITFNIIKRKSEIADELVASKVLERKKDEFISIASHELKTPLTSIKAFMQLLAKSDMAERERIFLQKANSNINKLNRMIGDLLDVSKVEAGRLQLNIASFSLDELIDESIENVQHMQSSHQIIKQNSTPGLILHGDILRLEQVMINLLVNAIKYSPGTQSIYINTQVLINEVHIQIMDKGLGISEGNQEKIFDQYFRAEEVPAVISGLGMGLYISNQIIMCRVWR